MRKASSRSWETSRSQPRSSLPVSQHMDAALTGPPSPRGRPFPAQSTRPSKLLLSTYLQDAYERAKKRYGRRREEAKGRTNGDAAAAADACACDDDDLGALCDERADLGELALEGCVLGVLGSCERERQVLHGRHREEGGGGVGRQGSESNGRVRRVSGRMRFAQV